MEVTPAAAVTRSPSSLDVLAWNYRKKQDVGQ